MHKEEHKSVTNKANLSSITIDRNYPSAIGIIVSFPKKEQAETWMSVYARCNKNSNNAASVNEKVTGNASMFPEMHTYYLSINKDDLPCETLEFVMDKIVDVTFEVCYGSYSSSDKEFI